MSLTNNKEIHAVLLKLNKNIPRERELREFLDNATSNGINRKEAILRIFEEYNNSNPFKKKERISEEIVEEKKENMAVIKANKDVSNVADFEE